ncbi:MAG: hypothetical protein FWB80_05920 [Defluviitaleaceae bacterium]|nr:hypothetical protein [Defluviitaleaceae bacterium]
MEAIQRSVETLIREDLRRTQLSREQGMIFIKPIDTDRSVVIDCMKRS